MHQNGQFPGFGRSARKAACGVPTGTMYVMQRLGDASRFVPDHMNVPVLWFDGPRASWGDSGVQLDRSLRIPSVCRF